MAGWLWKSNKRQESVNQFLNFFAFVLILVTIAPVMIRSTRGNPKLPINKPQDNLTQSQESVNQQLNPNPASKPDVYYIILDGYGRSDVLQEMVASLAKKFYGRISP